MKTLEIIFKEQIDKSFYFYLLDYDLLGKTRDISVAVIKISEDTNKILELQKIVSELYKNTDYILKYDSLI